MNDFVENLSPTTWRIACWILMPLGALALLAGMFLLAGAFAALWLVVGMFAIELLCALAAGGAIWLILHCRG